MIAEMNLRLSAISSMWRVSILLLISVAFSVGCCQSLPEEAPTRLTYCGRAVSISDDLSPKVLLNDSSDPIGCKTNSDRFRTGSGESYTKCSVNEILLHAGTRTPLFGVEIGNVEGQVTAFLEADHVRGICMESDLTDPTAQGRELPKVVCFHKFEPGAKFLARTCTSRGCRNHFFLAAIGACGDPEVLEGGELSFAVAGTPIGWEGSMLQRQRGPNALASDRGTPINATMTFCSRMLSVPQDTDPYTLLQSTPATDPIACSQSPGKRTIPQTGSYTPCLNGKSSVSSISSTPLYKIVLGQAEVLVSAGLPLGGTIDKVCLGRIFVYAPSERESDIQVDKPCFKPGEPAMKFVATTCLENGCIDHYFLASSGECSFSLGG